jgi:hypothetical protein
LHYCQQGRWNLARSNSSNEALKLWAIAPQLREQRSTSGLVPRGSERDQFALVQLPQA